MLKIQSLLPVDKTKPAIQNNSEEYLENRKGNFKVIQGDALSVLKTLPDKSVQCCITSPPYWGLRDYQTAKWEGGDPVCNHSTPRSRGDDIHPGDKQGTSVGSRPNTQLFCIRCRAKRIDDQIGLEETPEEYVDKLVDIFREVKRVLRDDGTLFIVIGDTYSAHKDCKSIPDSLRVGGKSESANIIEKGKSVFRNSKVLKSIGLKNKDLVGIPWSVAFALRADGWYLRQDIIWSKPNPMPESVTDRCTKSHEYVFLLTKSEKYYFDNEAIREPVLDISLKRSEYGWNCDRPSTKNASLGGKGIHTDKMGDRFVNPSGRNKRSVWTITTKPFKDAHFAVFPEKLVEPCILAGTSPKACGICGAPWERIVERVSKGKSYAVGKSNTKRGTGLATAFSGYDDGSSAPEFKTLGWRSTCEHNDDTGKCLVLDPFSGSGTTGVVAKRYRRKFIGIELNKEYIRMSYKRARTVIPVLVGSFKCKS